MRAGHFSKERTESAFEYATRGDTSARFCADVPARAVNLSLRMLWRMAAHFAMHDGLF
jgi:hypothetical protein